MIIKIDPGDVSSRRLGGGACFMVDDFGGDDEVTDDLVSMVEECDVGDKINDAGFTAADPELGLIHPDAAAWAELAIELAKAAEPLANRKDCCGGYFGTRATTHKREYRKTWLPMAEALRAHFVARRIIGLHTTSLANTCGWMLFDFDAHEGSTDANMKPAMELAARIRAIGLTPYAFDSNGNGGLHLWVVFPRVRKTHRVFELARSLADGMDCEAFPKQPHVEPGRFGNWVRLPGKHYKRNHWSRLLTPQGWASADETIDAVIEMCGKRVADGPSPD